MTNPIADEELRLADGRLLAWAEWGDPRGSPVLFLHPSPGSRMLCPDGQTTALEGVRLITVDRPGYGRSDPVADPSLSGFAHDLARLVDHLWLGQFAVVGWSGGGQYAVASAVQLGERVRALALVATPAPDAEVPWLSPAARALKRMAEVDPQQALAAAADVKAPLAAASHGAGERWESPSDVTIRRQPDVDRALRVMRREGLRNGANGMAADLVAASRPWTFAPSRMAAPAHLFYGDDDPVVGLSHGRWWERTLPGARLTVIKGGHLLPFVAWPDILRAVQP
jgi:pimeloyl-ACP methyl ester carboxylesterase